MDSNQASGGTGPLYQVLGGGGTSCLPTTSPNPPLSFNLNPSNYPNTCDTITANVTASRGTTPVPPYTLSVWKRGDQSINITSSATNLTWVNTLTAGGQAICKSLICL